MLVWERETGRPGRRTIYNQRVGGERVSQNREIDTIGGPEEGRVVAGAAVHVGLVDNALLHRRRARRRLAGDDSGRTPDPCQGVAQRQGGDRVVALAVEPAVVQTHDRARVDVHDGGS